MQRLFLGGVFAVALAIGSYFALIFGGPETGDSAGVSIADFNPVSAAQAQEIDTSAVIEMTLGDPEAPVTLIEYASFTCPHCANFHSGAFKELKANYINTGKVYFIYREVYFDRYGLWAGMVARCGGAERYFGIVDLLYTGQSEWTAGGEPASIAEGLRKIGRVAGLGEDELNACLQDANLAQSMVAVYQENADRDEVRATPSFIINGEKYSNMSYADFSETIDSLIEG